MDWLNYHHLLYFYVTAREGGISPAARVLRLAHPTISGQLKQLEAALGVDLFSRAGRRLELTEAGRMAYGYAEEIFSLGRELMDAVQGRATGRPLTLVVGITDVIPKLVVRRLLQPAFALPEEVRVICHEDRHERLLASLALHELDVVLADAPVPPGSAVRAFNHPLGRCDVLLFAAPALAARLGPGFPASLDGAPLILPTNASPLRRSLQGWFDSRGLRPRVVAEVEDSALIKVLGADGLGVFAAPAIISDEVTAQTGALPLGVADGIRDGFYAITGERRLKNPAVVAISAAARSEVFTAAGQGAE